MRAFFHAFFQWINISTQQKGTAMYIVIDDIRYRVSNKVDIAQYAKTNHLVLMGKTKNGYYKMERQ